MKKLYLIATAIFLGTLSIPTVSANEANLTTSVRYEATVLNTFVFSVRVSGQGSIFDGSQEIQHGTIEYEIHPGGRKQFRIVPEKGYVISHVYFDTKSDMLKKEDIKHRIQNDVLTFDSVNEDIYIEVIFEKIKEEDNTQGNPEDGKQENPPEVKEDTSNSINTSTTTLNKENKGPVTGVESSDEQMYIWLLIGSYVLMLYAKRRHDKLC